MPSWNQVLDEIQQLNDPNALDIVRRKYLLQMSQKTGRNVIAYYSGWLQKPSQKTAMIDDNDKNGFMATIHKLDRKKGLDLVLHTPGGDIAATESLVEYLRDMFGNDIRAFVPQLAMSAGTMVACSCKEVIMGEHSNLGPIDPQFNGISTHGVIEEFKTAVREAKANPASVQLWQVIIGKYHPTFLGDCEKAIKWSERMVSEWLVSGMFAGNPKAKAKARKIVKGLSDHQRTKNHARHIHIKDLDRMGLVVKNLKTFPDDLQDTVLTIHHAYMHTFSNSNVVKITENHNGMAMMLFGRPSP